MRATLRVASDLENRWDPFDREYGIRSKDPFDASFERDLLLDYRSTFEANRPEDIAERQRLDNQIGYEDQTQQQQGGGSRVLILIHRSSR